MAPFPNVLNKKGQGLKDPEVNRYEDVRRQAPGHFQKSDAHPSLKGKEGQKGEVWAAVCG